MSKEMTKGRRYVATVKGRLVVALTSDACPWGGTLDKAVELADFLAKHLDKRTER